MFCRADETLIRPTRAFTAYSDQREIRWAVCLQEQVAGNKGKGGGSSLSDCHSIL